MKLTVVNPTGKNSTMTAKDEVFAAPMNKQLLAQGVRVYRANQRQGTSAAKTRSDVIRTTKKWYRQKGTGNARHGARSAHIFVGGGVAHGPKANQNWSLKMPLKMKRKALAVALSAQADKIKVSDAVNDLTGKTKAAAELIAQVVGKDARRVLIVTSDTKPEVVRSMRNLSNVIVTHHTRLNIYQVANATDIIMTKDAVKALEEKLS